MKNSFVRASVDFKNRLWSYSRALVVLAVRVFVGIVTSWSWIDCDVIADVNKSWGWDECIVPIGSELYAWNVRFDSRFILSFLNYFIFHVITGVEKGRPCIVEIGGTKGFALATPLRSPTAHVWSPTKAQPSTMHGQPFLTNSAGVGQPLS